MANQPSSTQLKVTIPDELYSYLKSKAAKFGLTTSSYLKNLIIDDVKDLDFPTFPMSAKTEQVALKALEEHKQGKTHQIHDVDEFLNGL
jgi:predicted DNA-binding protein